MYILVTPSLKMRSSFLHFCTLLLVTVLAFTMEVRFDHTSTMRDILSSTHIGSEVYAANTAVEQARLLEANGVYDPPAAKPPQESQWIKDAVDALNAILGLMTFLITPLIALAGWLLSPDWTRGDLFGLNIWLYKIWLTISNITYFLYALGLIGIALATIFNQENYAYKTMLPKLALGIIMVPFTWWIVQAIVSVSNILTVAVMQIPYETLQAISPKSGPSWLTNKTIPQTISYDNTGDKAVVTKSDSDCDTKNAGQWGSASDKCLSPQDILTEASSGPYSMLTVYAYNVFKIQEYKEINNVSKWIKAIFQVFNKLLFGAIIFAIFSLLIVAIVFALFTRAFELWIITMFSPLLTLSIALPDSMKSGEAFKKHLSFKNLISLAMVPVFVSAALSFGLLFIGLLMNGTGSGGSNVEKDIPNWKQISILGSETSFLAVTVQKWEWENTNVVTSTFQLGSLKLEQKWTMTNTEADAITKSSNFFTGSGGIIGTVILDVIALTILWIAVMAALKVSEITKAAIDPFEKAGKSIGDLGKSLPKYAPIPGLGMSMSGLQKTAEKAADIPRQMSDEQAKNSRLGKLFDLNKGASAATDVKLREAIQNFSTSPESKWKVKNAIASARNDAAQWNPVENSTTLLELIKQIRKIDDSKKREEFMRESGIGDSIALREAMDRMDKENMSISDHKYLEFLKLAWLTKWSAWANTAWAQQWVGSITWTETKDAALIKQWVKMELTLNTKWWAMTVYTKEDKKIHNFDNEIKDFAALFRWRATTEQALKEMIESQLKDFVHPEDIEKIKTALSPEKIPDILKKEGSSDTSKANTKK